MGVTGLWQILQPCARPIKIETLNRKRLAVDASIWIYQFLKAVRDKEGNALRNSHVVGFFRRICKLLFFGIKPVFVFDGGAPVLKRNTITNRKKRREGRREDAARTAGRLLAVQMQRKAEEEEKDRRDADKNRADGWEEEVPDDQLVYVDELQMSAQERQQNRKFRKKDAYHLPDLDVSMADMGGPNDPRIMSLEELEAYARQFDTGEDINVYDFSKIDYDSPFFTSLPASDRYNILNAARLRSRLRMGHSKEQLDTMFPDRMAFSKFQIDRVQERNELTQRLMNINDPNGEMEFGINGTGRVAGEKGREYVLVKNDGVEGGWALGVVSNEGQQERPIDVDKPLPIVKDEDDSDDDDGFEDVPIEGLNRLPKIPHDMQIHNRASAPASKRRSGRRRGPRKAKAPVMADPDSLFVAPVEDEPVAEDGSESGSHEDLFGEAEEDDGDDDAELQRAIAMSLETDQTNDEANGDKEEMIEDEFPQTAAPELEPIRAGSYREIVAGWNKRAYQTAPKSREITSFGVPVLRNDASDGDDDAADLQAALAISRDHQTQPKGASQPPQKAKAKAKEQEADTATAMAKKAGFSGPLPFESLNLGSSSLGKKKMQQRTEEAAGGFIDPAMEPKQQDKSEPLPPWFAGDPDEDLRKQKIVDAQREEKEAKARKQFQFEDCQSRSVLRRADTGEVIDLEAEDHGRGFKPGEVVNLDEDEDMHEAAQQESELATPSDTAAENAPLDEAPVKTTADIVKTTVNSDGPKRTLVKNVPFAVEDEEEDEEVLDWSESEDELPQSPRKPASPPQTSPVLPATPTQVVEKGPIPKNPAAVSQADPNGRLEREPSITEEPSAPRSPSVEFEDVNMTESRAEHPEPAIEADAPENFDLVATMAMDADSPAAGEQPVDPDDVDYFSDLEEEELLKALNLEAEEHARFASSLNNKSQAQNIADYEEELKQLRTQQKKDRRDADEVTQVMVQECQQLLRLFGLPYVTAPMEAEAQCAELVQLGLVDGIVTDDSDCFLFGGTRVYKNMFNQAKFVECYLTSDMEKEFQLTRDKLIAIAQLLGSDYTEGLTGVGPVTALEIISEFPTLDDFKAWLEGVQLQHITKEDDKGNPFRKKFRKTATKLLLPIAFPDKRVEMAYLEPDVDKDPESFQWGVPDLDSLRNFLMATIGWTQERADEILVPVIKDMNKRLDEGTQANITGFFSGTVGTGTTSEAFAPRKRAPGSKRLGNAMEKLAARAKRSRGGVDEEVTSSSAATPEQEGIQNDDDTASEATTGSKRKKAPNKRQTRKKARKSKQ